MWGERESALGFVFWEIEREWEYERVWGFLTKLMGEEREWESGMCEFKLCVDPQILGFVTKLPYSTSWFFFLISSPSGFKCKEGDPLGPGLLFGIVQTFLYVYVREKFKSKIFQLSLKKSKH